MFFPLAEPRAVKSLDIQAQIVALLSDPRFHDESNDDDQTDEVVAIAGEIGWHPVLTAVVRILEDTSLAHLWYDAVACLFCCDCHTLELPCDRSYLIALLYDCLRLHPDLGIKGLSLDQSENLVWSIVHNLKGVGYLSDYDPKADSEVLQHVITR